eukprot:1243772-Pyramimonas_sp.AAC.1
MSDKVASAGAGHAGGEPAGLELSSSTAAAWPRGAPGDRELPSPGAPATPQGLHAGPPGGVDCPGAFGPVVRASATAPLVSQSRTPAERGALRDEAPNS